ncbi:hypothetical protein QJS10_CPA02g01292 [Acorus calamus]|uniref:Uncharacterized protein n=1 Tax=Acorus calamus TaxID=4465 RepID=A0AAV9FFY5_ACOCL|nr:hypothetical protein QJS10_CPA02g01292 [Acorus calamus]
MSKHFIGTLLLHADRPPPPSSLGDYVVVAAALGNGGGGGSSRWFMVLGVVDGGGGGGGESKNMKRGSLSFTIVVFGKFAMRTALGALIDNRIGILSGDNFMDVSMIRHDNQTGRWLSSFRVIWGWDDSYVFVGNMKRAVDVISTVKKTTKAMESPLMTAIPCRFAAHPYRHGTLASTTSGGQIYMWTSI